VTRVIAGVAGGRRLAVPAGRRTRPTSDRAREGLFSSLGELTGAAVLDLYAGSGAVGLEAASRGAAAVVLVEREPHALAAIRANVEALGLAAVEVRAELVERFLAGAPPRPAPFDVVYVDPPYADPVDGVLALLAGGGWLAAGATVVVERDRRSPAPAWPAPLVAHRSRRYGDSTLWYGRRP
jgi:16S rRNA (guanine966-N2)-methyltransferase